ncbi:MAG: ABC transporter ATP-binding protein [Bacteroidetes bacterium]|nr:MAG: ABC transporter ATP-binding protein [Bacteroidota bacterium]REK00749.1 MAG: ABC transporter ATP-binding protein [Bacteroidota bacterium]REK34997.1 MAG: ABC transporter ATP-binding protein [Bacteroidota bacterium]REK48205.1 MAG: ABC transporter ATP-binding protein [Bacteroidota bacterium]
MPDKIIEVRDLKKNYGPVAALQGIDFTVYAGEIFGLLGPNGAGKTTTLEIMETLLRADSGSVSVCGFDVEKHPSEIKRRIAVQLQSSGYYPNLTLRELLELFSGLYNVKSNPQSLLEIVGLEEKGNARYKHLSGGQKQRFSICTTLIHNPEVIFLDEPTTGLDPQARRNLWKLIQSIRSKGTTIVLTTHYMEEAEQLCDRVLIIDSGKVIASGAPSDLIDNLVSEGFKREVSVKSASLEDVFISLTGRQWRNT